MFNTSNYYQQLRGLQAESPYQRMVLQWADASTLLREISKVGTVIGLVSSVSSLVFNFDPTIALTCTVVSGTSWLLTGTCAKKLEPQAKDLIQYFQEKKEGKFGLPQDDAHTFGLME